MDGNAEMGEIRVNDFNSAPMLLQVAVSRMQIQVKAIPQSEYILFCCGLLFCLHVCGCGCVCVYSIENKDTSGQIDILME